MLVVVVSVVSIESVISLVSPVAWWPPTVVVVAVVAHPSAISAGSNPLLRACSSIIRCGLQGFSLCSELVVSCSFDSELRGSVGLVAGVAGVGLVL